MPAIACALTPVLCYIIIRPYAEIGLGDDWSYVKTAQVLAQTSHFAYYAADSPMLGWQVYFGALFIKLFGFSFTAVRFTTVFESMATAFLLQRTFIRAGLNSWNSTLATLTFVLSPLYLSLAFTFMTDVSGVLCIVVCLYMCLRAVQAESEYSAMAWISSAALLNAGGGTARQIAWLGVLVMVPSTLWLLRKRRRVLLSGCLSCIAGAIFAVAAMHWFARQPHTDIFSPALRGFGWESFKNVVRAGMFAAEQLALLALPVLIMYAGSLRLRNRRMVVLCATTFLCLAFLGITLAHTGILKWWITPNEDGMTDNTLRRLNAIAIQVTGLSIADYCVRFLFTGLTVLGILSFAAYVLEHVRWRPVSKSEAGPLSWQKLGIIVGPFSAAYIAILALISQHRIVFNRYLLPLLFVLLLTLVRYYQESAKTHLPLVSVLLIAVLGGFTFAALHDGFALYRGYRSEIDEVRSHGTTAAEIFEPWEFVGWTEIEQAGYANYPGGPTPQAARAPVPAPAFGASCDDWSIKFLTAAPASAIQPVYAITVNPNECSGTVAFQPVVYRTWVAPHINSIYAVRLPASIPH